MIEDVLNLGWRIRMSGKQSRYLCATLTVAALVVGARPATAQSLGLANDEKSKIVHFHLSGQVGEIPREDPFGFSGGKVTSMKQLLSRLASARKDESVKAVAITVGQLGMGLAQLEELHEELMRFRSLNKRVFVHVDNLNTGSYALLSAASDISIVPTADVWVMGVYTESVYLKGLLDKIGVHADIIHMGDYKSAGEIFTQTEPSEEAAANMNWLLDGLFGGMVEMMADGRGLSAEQVQRIIDGGPYTAESAKEAGLVDAVQYRSEFMDELRKIYGSQVVIDERYGEEDGLDVDFSNPFAFFSIFSELLGSKKKPTKDAVGVVYVEGAIVPGFAEPNPFGGGSGAYSGDIRKALDEAADDPKIKAVVLRVDSPGGSALASEIILEATKRVMEKKPLIVSMGNLAASGGYYVSCAADTIFADETTITASIGVVGGKLITTGMWDKLGVNWVPYQRGANADLMSSSNKFDESQRKHIHDWMDEIYGVFKGHVTKHRGDKLTKSIDELAGGRVFTGKQGLEYGLVDKLGGLSDAVEHAARLAKLGDYDVRVVPEPKNFMDVLFKEMTGEGERPTDLTFKTALAAIGAPSSASIFDTLLPALNKLDPLRVSALLQGLKRLELIHREGVVVMMPMEFIVR
jgi:protease-4